jgi:hypothetical protein
MIPAQPLSHVIRVINQASNTLRQIIDLGESLA